MLNLICFASCVEGLFFFAAFAYVYFLRSRGLLHGLAGGTNWVFRDESAHMAFAYEVVRVVRAQEPDLFDGEMMASVHEMMDEAIACETQFAEDLLSGVVVGLSVRDLRQYLEYVADQRLGALGLAPRYGARNPFAFMDLQDVQEVANFFERRVSAYQIGVTGEVSLDAAFGRARRLGRRPPDSWRQGGAGMEGPGQVMYKGCMKRTNVVLDGRLLARARKLTGVRTTREILGRALEEMVAREEQRRLAARLRGSGWDGSLSEMRKTP